MSKPTKKRQRPATAREREAAAEIFNLFVSTSPIVQALGGTEPPTAAERILFKYLNYLRVGIISALQGTSIGDHIGKLQHRRCLSNENVLRGTKKASTTTKTKNKRKN